ncbi:MAG: DUF975 family protein [Odoribacter sp.]
MLTTNNELRAAARLSLTNKWGISAVVALVYILITAATTSLPIVGTLGGIFLILPLGYGVMIVFLKSFRGEEVEIGRLFDGFNDYWRIFGTMILVYLYTFLWSLLLIIPGIIKSYSYGLTSYILLDEPELKYDAAIQKSMAMMRGNKMKLFLLDLSFIGWGLLCILTLGIGFLWLSPYIYSARAAFYQDLKKEAIAAC